MAKFSYGELGFEAEGSFNTIAQAQNAAVEQSISQSYTAVSVWDEYDEVLSVALGGELFVKQEN